MIEPETLSAAWSGLRAAPKAAFTYLFIEHLLPTLGAIALLLSDRSGKWLTMPAETFGERLGQLLRLFGRAIARGWKRDGRPVLPSAVRMKEESDHVDELITLNRANAGQADKILAQDNEISRLLALVDALQSPVPQAVVVVEDTRMLVRESIRRTAELQESVDRAIKMGHGVDPSRERAIADALKTASDMSAAAQAALVEVAKLTGNETPSPTETPAEAQTQAATGGEPTSGEG